MSIHSFAWLLVPLLALLIFRLPASKLLPGSWNDTVNPGLARYLERWVGRADNRSGRAGRWLLCLLISLALVGFEIGERLAHPATNLTGRIIVIAMDPSNSMAGQLFVARQLAAEAKQVPTGLIASAGDAFDIVPMTTDGDQIDRYLSVLSPSIMPEAGDNLADGISRAQSALRRADILAGQIVVIAASPAPGLSLAALRPADRQTQITFVVPALTHPRWRAHADSIAANLIAPDNLDELNQALQEKRQFIESHAGPISVRQSLTPWVALLCLPLWAWLYLRRTS